MFDETQIKSAATSDKASLDLLEAVIQDLNDGRRSGEIIAELVRQNWTKDAATQFCSHATIIHRELRYQPESRASCAQRGYEGMQVAAGWIGFGACGGIMMYLVGNNARTYSVYALLPILYGVVELVSGFLLWWPHRDFLKQGLESTANRLKKS